MIMDRFDRILFYSDLLPHLKEGLEAVKQLPKETDSGKYEFEGGFFLVQKGETKPMEEGYFETHQKYIDVQIVLEGQEEVAWADQKLLEESVGYDVQTDKTLYRGEPETIIKMSAGMCYIAFSHDAHKAVRHTGTPCQYRKIVMKLQK